MTSSSSSSSTTRRDWSQLPSDLLQNIASHLPHLSDHVRFSSVCNSWRSASKSALLLPQPPWLLLLLPHTHPPTRFLSLFESKTYTLPLTPEEPSSSFRLFPFSDGWIALLSPQSPSDARRSIALTNPISGSTLPLPPLQFPRRALRSPETFRFLKSNHLGIGLVAALCPDGPGIAFCRPGGDSWRGIDTSSCFPQGDFAFHGGKFFVFNKNTRVTSVFDLESCEKVGEVEGVDYGKDCDHYLVESHAGELLLVLRYERIEGKRFELFRLEEVEEEGMKWVEIGGLDDGVLFLDSLHGMCFAASGFRGWRGNCIYFVDYIGDGVEDDCGVRLYDVGEDRVEQVSVFSGYSAMDWRRAMWIVPSFVAR